MYCIKIKEGFLTKDSFFEKDFRYAVLYNSIKMAKLIINCPFLKEKNAKIFKIKLEEMK